MAFEATTWSPTDKGAAVSLSADKLTASYSAASGSNVRAAVGKTSGKWYWELTLVAAFPGTNIIHAGVWPLSRPINTWIWGSGGVFSLYQQFAQGDIWCFAFDADAGTLTVSKGATQSTVLTGLAVGPSEPWAPMVGDESGGGGQIRANFGASAFAFAPPAGYTAGYGVEPAEAIASAPPLLGAGEIAVLCARHPAPKAAEGWVAGQVGVPTVATYIPPTTALTAVAKSFGGTLLGLPAMAGVLSVGASGFSTTGMETPKSRQTLSATPASQGVDFPLPMTGLTLRAGALHATSFGAPAAGVALSAESVATGARWGAVSANTDLSCVAGPVPVGTTFGAHVSSGRYLPQHAAPNPRFGKPLLVRIGPC